MIQGCLRAVGGRAGPSGASMLRSPVNLIYMLTSHRQLMKNYNLKIIESPSTLEIWRYSKPIERGWKEDRQRKRRNFNELMGYEKVESLRRRIQYYKNKRFEIRRLIDVNFDNRTSFLTLTQNGLSPIGKSVEIGNYEFDKFIRRLKRYLKRYHPDDELKYLATWERTKKGLIHYHIILFGFPFIEAKTLEMLWGNGFIKINQIKPRERGQKALYVSKYFTKDLEFRDAKKKAYFKSRNLKHPPEYKIMLQNDLDISSFGIPEIERTYRKWSPEDDGGEVEYFLIRKQ